MNLSKTNIYEPTKIEDKWAEIWEKHGIYKAIDHDKKPKSYVLIEFPYPSGERLHVGHARSYSCLDAVTRMRRMKGMNVMFPIGWDAFGLPAENYAIKTGIHPAVTTAKNIENSKKQAISWGLSFDWDREINTTDSNYYKWTQWIFIQLFKKGLAYKDEIAVNWCPSCKTNLANEEVIDGKCERCQAVTERRKQAQWLLKITNYADRLLDDLKTVDFREDIAASQINWIGRKEGINISYEVEGMEGKQIEVFTTRPDTNFGATFLVLAPEHELTIELARSNLTVQEYAEKALNKSERERQVDEKIKTGVFTGLYAINRLNGYRLPIWVADFVLGGFGTGAVVGVPGHDRRDFEFAKAMGLPVVRVVTGEGGERSKITDVDQVYEGEGIMMNSGLLDGLGVNEAISKICEHLEEKGWGRKERSYHLRDWVFSRQHYWGEPIPMIYCDKCKTGGKGERSDMPGWYSVPEADLPVELPKVEKYQPTGTGESPLGHVEEFLKAFCPKCGGKARRETDTMPNWAGSSWYFLRYIDPKNDTQIGDSDKLKYWLPVDWYNGGMEHTTLHLLYSRFWHKFLFDLGVVPTSEPYAKRTSHGVVLGPDGRKMSKSRGNVINPDEIVGKYGADTLRMYEMFIGPFEQTVSWSDESLEGIYRFLKRVWVLATEVTQGKVLPSKSKGGDGEMKRKLALLIKKIESDLEAAKFNTTVAAMMEFVNWWSDNREKVDKDVLVTFLKLLAPMAPFISEELYQRLSGVSDNLASIHQQQWPTYGKEDLTGGSVTLVVQVDGRVRGTMQMEMDNAQDKIECEAGARGLSNVARFLNGEQKVVFVPGRLINFINL